MSDRLRALVATVALVFATSLFSYYAGAANLLPQVNERLLGGVPRSGDPTDLLNKTEWGQIKEVQQYVKTRFVDQVTDEQLLAGALKGMVQATGDKYSTYMTAEEYKRFLAHFEGSFSGIGVKVELSTKTNLVTVVQPLKGTPGEQAGLRAGDAFLAVDGKDVTRMTLEEVVQLIRGPQGSKVVLTIRREGTEKPLEFTIQRATIEMTNLEARMLDDEIGYVRILEFNQDLGKRVQAAIADLKKKGMKRGLVLDLRQNPGGLLTEAVSVSSLFVERGDPVVHIVSRPDRKETLRSEGRAVLGMRLVVLIDQGSASASEIVAGAIKDLKAGVLIGEKSFGKGSVQTFFDVEGTGGGLKLTTARYLTAGGLSIHEKGIEPDIRVALPDPKVMPGDPDDTQLARAIQELKK